MRFKVKGLGVDSVENELEMWLAQMDPVDAEVEAARQRIGRLARQFNRVLERAANENGLSLADWEALSVIERAGEPCRPSLLMDQLGLTSGTVSVRIARLTEAGLVEPVAGADGRSRPVRLTTAGRRRWRRATATRTAIEAELFGALAPAQLARLNPLLARLLASFEGEFGVAPRHDRTG